MLHRRRVGSRVRLFFVVSLLFRLSFSCAGQVVPSAADGYVPGFDGNVYVLALQPDGKAIVGGQFANYRDRDDFTHGRRNLARLNADGSLDASFNPDANGPLRAILVQPDGRILIGGDFTTLQPNGAASPVTRNRLARLNTDGTVDAGFDPNLGGDLLPQVYALVRQSDGRIVVGGSFTTVRPNGAATAFNRTYLARFHADGALDTGWDPHPNSIVLALALHLDDKLLVGGGFTSFWESGSAEPSNRFRLARLNPSGTLDSEFNMEVNNAVNALAVQRDGKILVGGTFTTFKHVTEEGVANRTYLARLNPGGTVDSEFYPGVNGGVARIAVATDGGFLVGGSFTAAWSRSTAVLTRSYVARFRPDGAIDPAFDPGVNGQVQAFAFQSDGKFLVGGYFTRVQPAGSATGLVRQHLARFNRNGTLDTDFRLVDGGRVLATAVQGDGKIVVAGSFTQLGGVTHNYLARLHADGSIDHAYAPSLDGRVYALAYEPGSGKVIAGGSFSTIAHARTGSDMRHNLARFNPDGTPDSEFNPNLDGQVVAVLLQPDGRIVVGGSFNTVQPIGATSAITRSNLLRLNANGSIDPAFHPNPNSSVASLALQADGKLVVGGLFSAFTDDVDLTPVTTTASDGTTTTTVPTGTTTTRGYLARLGSDGRLDPAFTPTLNGQVNAIVVQADGRLVLAGAFTSVTGSDGTLVTQTNADGTTAQVAPTRNRIARLETDGDLDFSYDPNPNGSVFAAVLRPDGRVVIGGAFTTLQPNGASQWTLRKYAARLNADGTLDESFNLDLSEEAGNRVDSLRLLADGRLLVGGRFTSLQPTGSPARVLRDGFARIEANGVVDAAFNPGAGGPTGGEIQALAVQPDDKIVAVGDFSDLGGAKTTNIARFRPEGTPDATFGTTLATDGPIHSVIVRPIAAAAASQVAGFAWLERDGALRRAFAPSGPARFSGLMRAMARERDGSLLLGGAFSDLSNHYTSNLVRYRPNGAIDPTFQPVINGLVAAIAVQADGRIVIGGAFTTVNGVARNYLARLDADGALDVTFDPAPNAAVHALLTDGEGRVVVAGAFTTFYLNSTDDDEDDEDNDGDFTDDDEDDDDDNVARNYLARINPDGTVDSTYYPTPNGEVHALAFQADGKVFVGGAFTTLQPNGGELAFARSHLARLNADGTLDQNFDPSANGSVLAIVVEPDGQILVGGEFTTFQPFVGDSVITRNHLARLNSDSTVDLFFDPNANGVVRALALQPDDAILVGGAFTSFTPNGSDIAVTRNYLGRLNADGTLDLEFNPDVDGIVYALQAFADGGLWAGGAFSGLQPNGALIVGGSFSTLGGIEARNLAMLSDRGSVNASFRPRPDGAVHALLALEDGRFLAGGAFTVMNGAARGRLARFAADGTLDAAFAPGVDGTVTALASRPDGRVLVGGAFTAVGGQARANLAQLGPDGSLDAGFVANVPGAVSALALQADGRLLYVAALTGGRTQLGRLKADGSPDGTASLATVTGTVRAVTLLADGRVLVAGTFNGLGSLAQKYLLRLNADLTLDATFNAGADGPVTALAVQSDGRVMLGGNFSQVGGQARYGLARLTPTQAAAQRVSVTADRTTVRWSRSGSLGEVATVLFERSTDALTWTPLGAGTREAGTGSWQLAGQVLPANGLFYIRARGIVPTSAGVASGTSELVAEFDYTYAAALGETDGVEMSDTRTAMAESAVEARAGARAITASAGGAGAGVEWPGSAAVLNEARLTNFALRAGVAAGEPLIVDFVVAGSSPRPVLVRAVGPGLAELGVAGAAVAPQLRVIDDTGRLLSTAAGWPAALRGVFGATGAFALAEGSGDAAALLSLAPGSYALQVEAGNDGPGVVLAEIYDAGEVDSGRLVKVSARGVVRSGVVFVGGFVVGGSGTKRLLVRGAGASLTGTGAGAFSLVPGVGETAAVVEVPAGAYTVQIAGDGEAGETRRLEVSELP